MLRGTRPHLPGWLENCYFNPIHKKDTELIFWHPQAPKTRQDDADECQKQASSYSDMPNSAGQGIVQDLFSIEF